MINIFQSIQEDRVTNNLPKLVESNNHQKIGNWARYYLSISSDHQWLIELEIFKACENIMVSSSTNAKLRGIMEHQKQPFIE